MEKINWKNGETPINQANLNGMQNNIEKACVAVSPTQPTTNESVWIKKGKNEFNKNNATIINGYVDGNGNYNTGDSTAKTIIVSCRENTDYTVSRKAGSYFRIGSFAKIPVNSLVAINSNVNGANATSLTINTGNGAKYLAVTYFNSSETLTENEILNSLQIEQGSTATDYEAYIEKEIYVKNDNGVFERFYSENELNQQNYSTNEQVIGIWTNGKPIYRRVITGNITANANARVINNLVENCSVCVNAYGMFDVQSSQGYCSINGTRIGSDGTELAKSGIYVVNNTLMLATITTNARSSAPYYITVEYTKTTD